MSFYADAQRRDPVALLEAWPTLSAAAAAVARAGVDITVVQAAHTRRTLERDGVQFHFVDDARGVPLRLLGRLPVPRRPSRLLSEVMALSPDVVHVHGLTFPVAIHQLAHVAANVPVLIQDHGTVAPTGWRRRVWRWALGSVTGVAFTAREQARPFFRAGVFRADLPVFEVVGGSSSFTPGNREAARRATGMFGDPCYLWASHLDINKDPLTMLDAFELAAPHLRNARLWCCYGKASLLDDVKRRIGDSSVLRERVTLVGSRPHSEMQLWFQAADFFVQTSRREASGFSLLEALSCGTTPIVTDIPASRRIVGSAGSLTRVGDAPAMANEMVSWAQRDSAELRETARARFEAALSFDAIGRELRDAYETLASRR